MTEAPSRVTYVETLVRITSRQTRHFREQRFIALLILTVNLVLASIASIRLAEQFSAGWMFAAVACGAGIIVSGIRYSTCDLILRLIELTVADVTKALEEGIISPSLQAKIDRARAGHDFDAHVESIPTLRQRGW